MCNYKDRSIEVTLHYLTVNPLELLIQFAIVSSAMSLLNASGLIFSVVFCYAACGGAAASRPASAHPLALLNLMI
jgi:hypothetical protein